MRKANTYIRRMRAIARFPPNCWQHLRLAAAPGVLGAVLCMSLAAPARCAVEIDNEVKAAFIIRFTEFIDWPERNDPGRQPLIVCVLGDHPVEPILARLTQGYIVRGRTIDIRHVANVESAGACDVVFVPDTQSAQLPALSRALHALPVLVITNGPGLATAGSAINLFREGSRLRFEINPGVLEAAGLKASSRLLKLAVIRE